MLITSAYRFLEGSVCCPDLRCGLNHVYLCRVAAGCWQARDGDKVAVMGEG